MAESLLNTPILWINAYLKEKLVELGVVSNSSEAIPFFPTGPSTIDELTQNAVSNAEGVFAVWDRMFKKRRKPFPHIRDEQVLYYFYATQSETGINSLPLIKLQEAILRLLDRGDESAEDFNRWMVQKGTIEVEGETLSPEFFFHEFSVYQLEESRDIIDFGTARTFAGNKIIIDYCYHQMPTVY